MTLYLLDTNVISETARQRPNPQVLEWISDLDSLLLPSVAVYELAAGIKRAPSGKHRRFLEAWFASLLASECKVLPLDGDAALATADIEASARHQSRTVDHRDLLILGTAKAHSLGVATRNVAHFRGLSVAVYNPFEDAYFL